MTEALPAPDVLWAILEQLPIGIAIFTPENTLRMHNTRFVALTGIPTAGVGPGTSASSWFDRMQASAEYTGQAGASFLAAIRAWDRSHPLSLRRTRANGQVIDSSYTPLPDGGFTVTVSDVSAVASGEDTVRRRVTGLSAILEHIPNGVCVYGPDRRVSMFNAAYTEVMAGAPVAIGEHADDITRRRRDSGEFGPPGEAEIYAAMTIAGINTGSSNARRRVRPNGTVIDIRTALLPYGGYISVVTDITLQMKAEAEARSRAAQMETMLTSIRHGIVMWDTDRRVAAANRVAAELLEIDPANLAPGRSQADVLAAMIARGAFGDPASAEIVTAKILDRDPLRKDLRYITLASGQVIEVRCDPIPGGGEISGFTDITEARAAEDELRRAKEAAEAASQAKSRFLAAISHELRTPLNAVIGFSEQLMRLAGDPAAPTGPAPIAEMAEFAGEINAAGRALLDQINTLLDVARIDAGRFDLASEPIDVSELIETCVRQSDATARSAGIGVAVDVPADLPVLHGDARRLAQALSHLLSNAVKFSEIGGKVRVRARLGEAGDLLIAVRDTGIGIPAADLQRVLEPFTQADSTLSRRFHGAGLGLYISRALIEAHGGSLSLRSRPGAGTTVDIRLPSLRLEPVAHTLPKDWALSKDLAPPKDPDPSNDLAAPKETT
jgi:signal transduction histidine kinase